MTTPAPTLESLLAHAEALYLDTRLNAVREWKAAAPGRHAIGYMPVWAPREILWAAGAMPVGFFGSGEIEIIKGDAYFQSYICHIPRSTVELGLNGGMDALEGMVFPSICDVIRNLSGMWKMLFPERFSWYLDLPQSFDQLGVDFFVRELKHMTEGLEKITGQKVTDERLTAAIELYNENRIAVRKLYDARDKAPWVYPTSEVYLVLRAGCVIPPEDHNRMIEDYLHLAAAAGRRVMDNARVVVAGSFCEQPPLNLIKTIERAGCYIVDDDFVFGTRLVGGVVNPGTDPMEAMARSFIEQAGEAAFLFRSENKGADLVRRARDRRAEGVLFCAPSFCDPALLDQPMLAQALDEAGVPYTAFKYAENTGQFQVIREQAGTFADSIKLWSVA